MNETEKIIRKYRKGIKLDAGEVQLIIMALENYKNQFLKEQTQKLLERFRKMDVE